ncbi:hypothetical protein [Phenylobacterium deserti]|uniref:Uncharacterized protein n=1 Tax=Phenylobacterium deserti TaxID=1914756 RepID=A0A328AQJ6_9CAUL|nr:hypothetical protein [Phenylobacterium deserti]RAK56585.1 hypothetical protein DJ018_00970 [Phenylobacterium deserti]
MNQSRPAGTNASDSAPGVDDGRVAGPQPAVNHKPAGKPIVWIIVAAIAAIVIGSLIARPMATSRGGEETVTSATTRAEVEGSTVPGTQNESTAPAPSQQIGTDGPRPAQ